MTDGKCTFASPECVLLRDNKRLAKSRCRVNVVAMTGLRTDNNIAVKRKVPTRSVMHAIAVDGCDNAAIPTARSRLALIPAARPGMNPMSALYFNRN